MYNNRTAIYHIKICLAVFMMNKLHCGKSADGTAQKPCNKEGCFTYAPFAFNGFSLVYCHHQKQNNIYNGIVNCYTPNYIFHHLSTFLQSRSPLSRARRSTSAVARLVARGILWRSQSLIMLLISGS